MLKARPLGACVVKGTGRSIRAMAGSARELVAAVLGSPELLSQILGVLQSPRYLSRACSVSWSWNKAVVSLRPTSLMVDLRPDRRAAQGSEWNPERHYLVNWVRQWQQRGTLSQVQHLLMFARPYNLYCEQDFQNADQCLLSVLSALPKLADCHLIGTANPKTVLESLPTTLCHLILSLDQTIFPESIASSMFVGVPLLKHLDIQLENYREIFAPDERHEFQFDVPLDSLESPIVWNIVTTFSESEQGLESFLPSLCNIGIQLRTDDLQDVLDLGVHARLQTARLILMVDDEARNAAQMMHQFGETYTYGDVVVAESSKLRVLHIQGPEEGCMLLEVCKADIELSCYKMHVQFTPSEHYSFLGHYPFQLRSRHFERFDMCKNTLHLIGIKSFFSDHPGLF